MVGPYFYVPLLEDAIDVHFGLGSVLEEGWKADVVLWRCEGSSGGGVHGFVEVFLFSSDGCVVVKYEKVGWIVRWGGSFI